MTQETVRTSPSGRSLLLDGPLGSRSVSTHFDFIEADKQRVVDSDSASAINGTLNGGIFTEGTVLYVQQLGAGTVSVVAGTNVVFVKGSSAGLGTVEQYGVPLALRLALIVGGVETWIVTSGI